MADTVVNVRLTGEAGQLVGQLNQVQAAEKGVSKEADALAAAFKRTDAAIDSLAAAQAEAKREIQAATAAKKAGTLSEEEYNRSILGTKSALSAYQLEHRKALNELNKTSAAAGGATQSMGAMRAASTNLGFQIQDITQGLAMGVNPMVVFGQQAGQTASAISGLGGTAGRVGTFLAGPWGSLILAAVTVVGMFIAKLWETDDALKEVKSTAEEAAEAMRDMWKEIRNSSATSAAMTSMSKQFAEASRDVKNATTEIRDLEAARDAMWLTDPETINALNAQIAGAYKRRDEAQKSLREAEDSRAEFDMRSRAALMRDRNRERNNDAPDKPKKPDRSAEREAQQLAKWGETAAERITRISEQFDAQPKLVDRVNRSVRELDDIVEDLNEKQPKGFQAMIEQARAAQGIVRDALNKPFEDYLRKADEARQVQQLILAGRDDEAIALRQIFQMAERVGAVDTARREEILRTVIAEREINEQIARRKELMDAQLAVVGSLRSDLEKMFSGDMSAKDMWKSMRANLRQMQAKAMVEEIFGPALRDLEKYVQENTGIQSSVDILTAGNTKAGKSSAALADAFDTATARITGATGGPAAPGKVIANGKGEATDPAMAEIVVTARKINASAMAMTPDLFRAMLAQTLVGPLAAKLDESLGTKFFGQLSGIFSGAVEGALTGGVPGGVLGALGKANEKWGEKLFGKAGMEAFGEKVGGALKGAETGSMVSSGMNMLGIKNSRTGAQIGGAVGSLIPIPGGEIIGSIAGGLIGGLLKTSRSAGVTLTGPDSDIAAAGGKDRKNYGAASDLAGSVLGGLNSIADALGGQIGAFNTTIGVRGGDYRVNTSGSSLKVKGGATDFNKDAEGAVRFAIMDAIADGAISGLSNAVRAALGSSADLDTAISEAVKVKELEALLGGFGNAAAEAFRAFEEQAAERLRLATRYGLELNRVEELNAKERIALRDQLERQSFGSLTDLLERMQSGDMFEGSAVDRRTALLSEIEKAKASAIAGDEGAADKLAGLLEQLNTVSRDVYGTTGGFAADRSGIQATAGNVISLLRSQMDSAAGGANAQIAETNNRLDENNDQNAQMIAELQRMGNYMAGVGFTGITGVSAAAAINAWGRY